MDFETVKADVKRKAWEIKHDAEIKFNEAKNWCYQNKEFLVIAAPLAYKGGKEILRAVKKTKEEKLYHDQECRIWDAKAGHHWHLRRPLCNDEKAYLNYRLSQGFSKYEILNEMHVLK